MQEIYIAGGCLWGVQEFIKHLPGVVKTEAGRANGKHHNTTLGEYDGYAECVKTTFDPEILSISKIMDYLFEIIDPYSINKQGIDEGPKYRTGIYSLNLKHLEQAKLYIDARQDAEQIAVEVLPLENYVRSDEEHQDRLTRYPNDYCHIPFELLYKYKKCNISQ